MNKDRYRQCVLHRTVGDTRTETVSYIPAGYAIVGKILQLKNDDDVWTDGWKVISVGEITDEPLDSHNAIKLHRKNTGDSLPKL